MLECCDDLKWVRIRKYTDASKIMYVVSTHEHCARRCLHDDCATRYGVILNQRRCHDDTDN